jgi:nicotinate-nucleotide adenylyltransferase
LKRYGIFGGAFNPVHTAHLITAGDVREQMHLDKVIFIPYANPPHKEHTGLLDAEHRLKMIALAIEGNEYFESSDIEIRNARNSKTYTVDTLLELRDLYRSDLVKFYLIIGLDNLVELHTWKEPGKLFLLSEVVVVSRPGYTVKDVRNEYDRQVIYIPSHNIDISSTEIRRRVKENRSIKYLVPEAVEKYIINNNLYN